MIGSLGDVTVGGSGLKRRRSARERDPARGLGRRKRRRHGAGTVGHIELGQGLPRAGSCNEVALKPLRDKEHAVGTALGAVALGKRVRKVVGVVADARDQLKARPQMLGKRTRKVTVVAVDHDHVGIVGLIFGELRRVPAHRCRDKHTHERDEHRVDEQIERVCERHAKRSLKGAHSGSFQRSAWRRQRTAAPSGRARRRERQRGPGPQRNTGD